MEYVIVAEYGSGIVGTCSLTRSEFRRDDSNSLCSMTMMAWCGIIRYAFDIYGGELVHGYWTAALKLGSVERLFWVMNGH
jgi:hypothetical protein